MGGQQHGSTQYRWPDNNAVSAPTHSLPGLPASTPQVPLLGMPADDKWALYGPETDKTLGMRNVLAYELFRRMGHWAPRTRYCEVRRGTAQGAGSFGAIAASDWMQS